MISAPSFFIILQRHQRQSTFSMSSECMFSVAIKKNIIMIVSFWSRVMWWKCCVTCLGVDQNEEEKRKDNVHRRSGSNVFCWKANQRFCFTCLRVGSCTMWNLSSLLHKSHMKMNLKSHLGLLLHELNLFFRRVWKIKFICFIWEQKVIKSFQLFVKGEKGAVMMHSSFCVGGNAWSFLLLTVPPELAKQGIKNFLKWPVMFYFIEPEFPAGGWCGRKGEECCYSYLRCSVSRLATETGKITKTWKSET